MIHKEFVDGRVTVKTGDLTLESVDAVVNAANSTLLGGAGVDGAIHRAGGPAILAECRELRRTRYPEGLPTGEAVLTTAGNLPANWIIHTVGPIYGRHGGREAEYLDACYRNSLGLCVQNSLVSVSFPAISTGVYSYPKDEAARIASASIGKFLSSDTSISEVRLVFFNEDDADIFLSHCSF
jgi:O-acetyl-ADP-ribose deacetylase (regulator of RNase III)